MRRWILPGVDIEKLIAEISGVALYDNFEKQSFSPGGPDYRNHFRNYSALDTSVDFDTTAPFGESGLPVPPESMRSQDLLLASHSESSI